uniref:L-lactate dehydrogenase n=1 Tax=Panstrongylus megistus TaxID=65343 RepID=A0A069DS47_9HEMI
MEEVIKSLMTQISSPASHSRNKLTVVGAGQVGMACAFACLTQRVADEIALVDIFADKVQGETLDLQHGIAFMPRVKIFGGSDYSMTKDSKVCIISAGARQQVGESRLDLLAKNFEIFKKIIPEIVKYSPDVIILVVSNPVDILSYVTWKLSGLPHHRVIGSGTNLDTARFKQLISLKFGINIQSVDMWILGEHGDSSVPVYSSLRVGDVALAGNKTDFENLKIWEEIHKTVVRSAYEIIHLKGYTSWAIGLSCSDICKSIFHNTNDLHALSTLAKGLYDINDEVYISLPCVLGQNGITHVINLPLTENEKSALQETAKKMFKLQRDLRI